MRMSACRMGRFDRPLCIGPFTVDRVSVPSPIAIDILKDAMARDRVHMYLFSV